MHKKAIFWNLIWAFKWIANTSAHSTSKEKCKTESTQPPFHWFSHVMHFLFNWMIYITVKASVNFTIEYIIDDFLQWGLKLRIKKLLVFSLGKFKSSDIEDQIPESTAGLYWFFSTIVQNLLTVMNYLNETLPQTKKFQGQKRPLQSFTLICFVMQITVIPLSSNWSSHLGFGVP